MHITFRQLKVFLAVARHLSFTRAAEILNLTQPAVSMQVKQLEESVGLPLLERMGKKIYLTDAGKLLREFAKEIIRQLEEIEEQVDQFKGLKAGKLRIAVATTANYFAPHLLATFIKIYPDISVSLHVTNRKGLIQHLEDNDIDLVIMGQPPEEMSEELNAKAFMQNPLVMIAPPNHSLVKRKHIPLKELQDQIFLVRERGSGTRNAMERHFKERELVLSTGMEMSTDEAIKQGVQAGLGLGIVSRHTIQMELEMQKLSILSVKSFPIVRHWFIVHRSGKCLSPVAQAFWVFILQKSGVLTQ
ncbi:MAG: hypothetical protein RIT27_340 [Pseudomonadota bacterium]